MIKRDMAMERQLGRSNSTAGMKTAKTMAHSSSAPTMVSLPQLSKLPSLDALPQLPLCGRDAAPGRQRGLSTLWAWGGNSREVCQRCKGVGEVEDKHSTCACKHCGGTGKDLDSGPPAPLVPDAELLVDLYGGNGRWKQQRAQEEWERQIKQREHEEVLRLEHEERQRIKRAEARERQRRREEAERKRLLEEQERQRRLEEERERLRREAQERERLRLLEEERQRQRKAPRPCPVCEGSSRCQVCSGKGYGFTLFLSSQVQTKQSTVYSSSSKQFGARPRGCEACSGFGDEATWGEYLQGSGKCRNCEGHGKVPAPPGGWPDVCAVPGYS